MGEKAIGGDAIGFELGEYLLLPAEEQQLAWTNRDFVMKFPDKVKQLLAKGNSFSDNDREAVFDAGVTALNTYALGKNNKSIPIIAGMNMAYHPNLNTGEEENVIGPLMDFNIAGLIALAMTLSAEKVEPLRSVFRKRGKWASDNSLLDHLGTLFRTDSLPRAWVLKNCPGITADMWDTYTSILFFTTPTLHPRMMKKCPEKLPAEIGLCEEGIYNPGDIYSIATKQVMIFYLADLIGYLNLKQSSYSPEFARSLIPFICSVLRCPHLWKDNETMRDGLRLIDTVANCRVRRNGRVMTVENMLDPNSIRI